MICDKNEDFTLYFVTAAFSFLSRGQKLQKREIGHLKRSIDDNK